MRFLILLLAATLHAQTFQKLDFLIGKWIGVGAGGQGEYSFEPQLDRKVIVRHNISNSDAGRHEDLMVIYLDRPADSPRAIYFDSEGHTIRYNTAFPSPNRVVFESDGSQPGPKYRLTYWLEGNSLNGSFEVAPPGAAYKPYLTWTSKKANG